MRGLITYPPAELEPASEPQPGIDAGISAGANAGVDAGVGADADADADAAAPAPHHSSHASAPAPVSPPVPESVLEHVPVQLITRSRRTVNQPALVAIEEQQVKGASPSSPPQNAAGSAGPSTPTLGATNTVYTSVLADVGTVKAAEAAAPSLHTQYHGAELTAAAAVPMGRGTRGAYASARADAVPNTPYLPATLARPSPPPAPLPLPALPPLAGTVRHSNTVRSSMGLSPCSVAAQEKKKMHGEKRNTATTATTGDGTCIGEWFRGTSATLTALDMLDHEVQMDSDGWWS